TEVGGTVGDIESLPFLEAIRQFGKEMGPDNIAYIHVTLAPFLKTSEEMKTKPTQHSVAELRSKGISPDVIVVRSEQAIDESIRQKISLFCDVPPEAVISASDTDNIYRMPLLLNEEGLDEVICRRLSLHTLTPTLDRWREMLDRMDSAADPVRVGMVGKYVDLPDAYASVVEALHHAAAAVGRKLEIEWILSENLTGMLVPGVLAHLDGIVVPGGFGGRGIEGKISAIAYARQAEVPFLGLCLGLQCAVIEFARSRLKLDRANSTEFDADTPHPVIDLMPSQEGVEDKGGTMRLGLYPASLARGSLVRSLYRSDLVYERHRHRWEVNPRYRRALVEGGMVLSGVSPDGVLVEFIELPSHPFFVGTQAHPEFLSRPDQPHPLFRGFMEKAAAHRSQRDDQASRAEVATPPRR
ncbi:MAG: CTP synthase, partial [bacterium]|nr:CTP synthase [bacterium]